MEILGLTKSLPRLRPACLVPIQIVRLFIPIHIPDSNVALTSIDPIQWDSLLFVVHRLSSHCGRKREMKTHSPNGFVISIPSTHDTDSVTQSLTGWLVLMFFHHITCLCCVRTMMVSLIKLYVIRSGEPQQQQLRRKCNNNEMRNELRGASMKGQEAVERGALSVASGWWGCCCCYSCGWVFARKRELIILTRILGRPRGFI